MAHVNYLWSTDGGTVVHSDKVIHWKIVKDGDVTRIVACDHPTSEIPVFEHEDPEECAGWLHRQLYSPKVHEKLRSKEEWSLGIIAGIISIAICEVSVVPAVAALAAAWLGGEA